MPDTKAELYGNNPTATLNGGINNAVTSLSVVSAAALPTGTGQFRIIIDSEIMLVTNVSGTTLTITRGTEGTTSASHSDGASISVILTAASVLRTSERHPFIGNRFVGRTHSAKKEPGTIITAGAESTILDAQGIGSGFISSMFFAITNSDFLGRERALVKVYIDGEGSPSFSATVVGMHAADYLPDNNKFFSKYITYTYTNATPFTLHASNYFQFPFTTGIKVGLTNPSATTSSDIAAYVTYVKTPIDWNWGRRKRLKAFEQRINANGTRGVAPYAQQDLLNLAGGNRGELLMIYMLMDGGDSNYNYLEGNHKFYVDGDSYPGSPSIEFPGTEDYFNHGTYFHTGVFAQDYIGTTKRNGTNTVGAYRIHELDPIAFDNGIRVTWNNGDSTQKVVANNTYLSSTVLYYLDT